MKHPLSLNSGVAETDDCGVLLVGHGTRDPRGTEQFFELGRHLAALMTGIPTEPALLEFQQPTIGEAWNALTARGVRRVYVAPLLLFAAGHAKQDIPEEIARCAEGSEAVLIGQSRPLSRHPAIVELVASRIRKTIDEPRLSGGSGTQDGNSSEARVAIVMVGRGNRDPCAQADMRLLTEVVRHRIPCGGMRTAFYAMANPRLPDVLDQVAAGTQFDRIVVYPHLLFQGRLLDAVGRQVIEAGERHSHVKFVLAEHLGPHELVGQAIRDRILQAAQTPSISAQYQ